MDGLSLMTQESMIGTGINKAMTKIVHISLSMSEKVREMRWFLKKYRLETHK